MRTRGLVVAIAWMAVLTACDTTSRNGGPPVPEGSSPSSARETVGFTPAPTAPASGGECSSYPPPFRATYLPEGFNHRLREGAGLFKGTRYPTEGLLGYYRGPFETVHVNFQIRSGPLPYVPANPRPVTVLGRRGRIGKIEGGYAVEFSNGRCAFRMDTYGLSRTETVRVAQGLRRTPR